MVMPWGKPNKRKKLLKPRAEQQDLNGTPESKKRLKKRLVVLQTIAPPPPEADTFRYLKRCYWIGRNLKGSKGIADLRSLVAGMPRHCQHDRFRAILELTAPTHISTKTRSRYAAALLYAYSQSVKSKDLVAFIKGAGGLKRCAQRSIKLKHKMASDF